jgi:RNA polymerase-binding transcription factor DksA
MKDGHTIDNLLQTRTVLKRRLAAIDADLSQALDDDSGERAAQTANDEVLVDLQEAAREELKAIAAAIDRLHAGTYGRCVLCNNPIGDARLTALPYAAFCVGCANDREQSIPR